MVCRPGFAEPEYGADLLKLDFPFNLRFVSEFADGAFDEELLIGIERQAPDEESERDVAPVPELLAP